jgi:hypothetical protein
MSWNLQLINGEAASRHLDPTPRAGLQRTPSDYLACFETVLSLLSTPADHPVLKHFSTRPKLSQHHSLPSISLSPFPKQLRHIGLQPSHL